MTTSERPSIEFESYDERVPEGLKKAHEKEGGLPGSLGTVCYPVIPRGAWAATTEFKLNLLAPVSDGTLSAVAQIISLTKRTAVVRIDVSNEDRLVCAAQGTVLIMLPKS